MLPQEINQVPIVDFLASIGYMPERRYNGYWIFKSFWNPAQKTGSIKVSANNLWVDYSQDNKGGTLIDLILELYPGLSVKDVVKKFSQGDFSFHQQTAQRMAPKQEAVIRILADTDIYHRPELIRYLKVERAISCIEMAGRYLKAYQYQVRNKLFWNLGTENHFGGHNLFAKGFKCATKQGYTLFKNTNVKSRIYFEGVLDFLSFLMLYPEQEAQHDYCILNSVNNLKKALITLPITPQVISFFDNDPAGDKATLSLQRWSMEGGGKFYDCRERFKDFKDLNDFLRAKSGNQI